MGLINGRIFGGKNWLFQIFTLNTYRTVNNFLFSILHFCSCLGRQKSMWCQKTKHTHMCTHSETSQSFLSTTLLKASMAGTAKTYCATTVIWEMRVGRGGGERPAQAWIVWSKLTHSTLTEHAKPTASLPETRCCPVIHLSSKSSAAQRQFATKQSGRDVYIATGVLCMSNYRSTLPHSDAFILTMLSKQRQPFLAWLVFYLLKWGHVYCYFFLPLVEYAFDYKRLNLFIFLSVTHSENRQTSLTPTLIHVITLSASC